MIFVYPKDVQKGDFIFVNDDGVITREEVESVSLNDSDPENKKVMVFTKKRAVFCDPGQKLQVERFVEHSVGE